MTPQVVLGYIQSSQPDLPAGGVLGTVLVSERLRERICGSAYTGTHPVLPVKL